MWLKKLLNWSRHSHPQVRRDRRSRLHPWESIRRRPISWFEGPSRFPTELAKTFVLQCSARLDKEKEATDAGAAIVGGKELAEAIAAGRDLDFDVAIATPDMMSEVGKLGRVLGPRGLMPNPKAGTVTQDVGKAVTEFKAGRIEYRNDRYGNVHVPVGRVSFGLDQLIGNLAALTAEVERARPAGAKGRYMKGMSVSSTMGPGVKVDVGRVDELVALVV